MVACRYGISLLVFNSTSHSWAIELNTRREIPYLPAPMYYSLYTTPTASKAWTLIWCLPVYTYTDCSKETLRQGNNTQIQKLKKSSDKQCCFCPWSLGEWLSKWYVRENKGRKTGIIFTLQMIKYLTKYLISSSGLTCFVCLVVGLLFCQTSGEYWLQMFDSFTGTLPLLFICFFELVGVSWIYGANR